MSFQSVVNSNAGRRHRAKIVQPRKDGDEIPMNTIEPGDKDEDLHGKPYQFRLWDEKALAYYEESKIDDPPARQTPKDLRRPEGSMPETVAYIWPKRALVYCDSHPTLPVPRADNGAMSSRELVRLHNAGFKVKDIAATVLNPSPARPLAGKCGVQVIRASRAPVDSLGGRLSQRDQSYRLELGVFPSIVRMQGSKNKEDIFHKLADKSVGQLFHGIVGRINHLKFTWTPPRDPMHTDDKSNVLAEYDLPPPEDIPQYCRQRINELRDEPLPSFATFLQECEATFCRYFPTTYASNHNGKYATDEHMLEAVENESMTRWAEIKEWSQETAAAKAALQKDLLRKEKQNEKAKAKAANKPRKRKSQVAADLDDDVTASPNKKARAEDEESYEGYEDDEDDIGSPNSMVDSAPSTPHQHRSRQPLGMSPRWSSPESFYHSEEREMPNTFQARQPTLSRELGQFIENPSSPATPDLLSKGNGLFYLPGHFTNNNGAMSAAGQNHAAGSSVRNMQQGFTNSTQTGHHIDFLSVPGRPNFGYNNSLSLGQNFGWNFDQNSSGNFDQNNNQSLGHINNLRYDQNNLRGSRTNSQSFDGLHNSGLNSFAVGGSQNGNPSLEESAMPYDNPPDDDPFGELFG